MGWRTGAKKPMAKRPIKKSGENSPSPDSVMANEPQDNQLDEPEVLEIFEDDGDDSQDMLEQLEEMGIDLASDNDASHFLVEPDDDDLEEVEEEGFDEPRLEGVPMADDPVRMYLKEIGQVQLLDPN